MIALASSALQRARTIGHKFFHRLGIHCATHQIRLILISCLVITSLFYPALAIYSSSQPKYIAHYSSQIIDSFLAASGVSARYAQQDLQSPWTGYDALRVWDDVVARARCGREQTLRIERLFVHSTSTDETGALNRRLLLSALALEKRISTKLREAELPCLKTSDDGCLTLSPWAFWAYDEDLLAADPRFTRLLSPTKNVSVAGVPVTPRMVLAGRDEDGDATSPIEFASFLALTYVFQETVCSGGPGHTAWLQILRDVATSDSDIVAETKEPVLMALKYEQSQSTGVAGVSALTVFIYAAYVIFFFWFSGSMRRVATVHSRIGLAFTGLVEIVVSTLTSLSVVALAGFKITMIPWQIFPIVIVFVGAENMFNLVDAVGKTSITLPMKERIAEGLSKAGTSNTLKVVTYNSILGTIAVFSYGAIRQFCAFSVVVLVAHWFLVHTFFITVVSIDMQRLELEELLQQNSLNPIPPMPEPKDAPQASSSRWGRALRAIQGLLRGRAAKNVSLFLLLAVAAALYYVTSPATNADRLDLLGSTGSAAGKARVKTTLAERDTPAWQIWETLNPGQDPLVHLRLESPTVVMFRPDVDPKHGSMPRSHNPRFTMRTLRAVLWLLKIFVLPIALTTTALYGLCLYLLKDAELLEAQKNRSESSPSAAEEEAPIKDRISFSTLPRAFPSDVELIAANDDGSVIASVGLQNEVVIWRLGRPQPVAVDVANGLTTSASSSSASSAITAIAMNDEGSLLALGTASGVCGVWNVVDNIAQAAGPFHLDIVLPAVTELRFLRHEPSYLGGSPRQDLTSTYLVAAYRAGTIIRWDVRGTSQPAVFTPSNPAICSKVALVPTVVGNHFLGGFLMEDGSLEVSDMSPSHTLLRTCLTLTAGTLADPVDQVHVAQVEVEYETRLVIATATREGVVSVFDGHTEECIVELYDASGVINNLRISAVPRTTCTHCGNTLPDVFTLSFSAGNIVTVYRASVEGQARYCSCSRPGQYVGLPPTKTLSKRASRNGLLASGPSTPLNGSRRSSFSGDGFPFPLSNHGVHSRRGSEKDTHRIRPADVPALLPDGEDQDTSFFTPGDSTLVRNGQPAFWQHVKIAQIAHTSFERGSWDVSEGKLVGLRRKPRDIQAPSSKPSAKTPLVGLAPATLERWELWFYDPLQSRLQASSLSVLGPKEPSSSSRSSRRSSDRRPNGLLPATTQARRDDVPRLPFTKVSSFLSGRTYCLAGLGNTVACFQFSSKPVQ